LQTFNHIFTSQKKFKSFLDEKNIDRKSKAFVQLFVGNSDPQNMQNILETINTQLPFASTISTSTAGEIIEGKLIENSAIVSLTVFESTDVHVELVEGLNEAEIAGKVANLTTPRTKLIIAFNNVYANDGEDFIDALGKKIPHIKIAGGNAGDNGAFEAQTVVGAGTKTSTTAVALALLDSERLQIFNEHLLNWQTIGEPMSITKANKSTIYEINNKKAQDVYREFLGDDVADNLPISGIEFPLIFDDDDLNIARAPVALGNNGELIMAGHIKEGETVKFGFGDIDQNDKTTAEIVQKFSKKPVQSIFIYSCSARKYFLKEHLNNEFMMLEKIAPTSGFITYGEFFKKDTCNKMLNVSSTFIGLSEDSNVSHNVVLVERYVSSKAKTLSALTHLIKQTSKHLEEKNKSLSQFQNIIKESALYSLTDTKGIIKDVNERFIKLSGYTRDELIGKPHNIVRHEDVPSSVYEDMWKTIKQKQSWSGIVKNRAKDGSSYYVRSHVFPILNIDGDIVEYISIRDDITDEVERKQHLEGAVNELSEKTKEKEYLLNQYEKIINLSSSFFRVDTNYNLIYVNNVFCDVYHCTAEKMVQKNIADILESNFIKTHFNSIRKHLQEKGVWTGVVPFQRKDKTIIYMDTSVNTIYDKNRNIVELMVVLHDITDLVVAQEEIMETQRDVVYTMGAIGETRSKETGNHVKRVAEYSKILALHYGLDENEAELLKMASPMHDIGKIGIPDDILNKPGKLTDNEWNIMKTHASLGYQMLKNSKREILQASAIVAHTHHEQWDGGGYPKGLKGEEIHIYGRITAIADVFDALGSDRCYKKAWEDEKIFELIKNGREKHFDPKLVDIFFKNLDIFLEIRSKFKD
jgi:PAS domain S-box-containing protein